MSGSTIGGIVGGVIGFVATGYNPQGFQWGWMIGSAVGGAVDPDVIKGPRLDDRKAQTSAEGIPRPLIYGLSGWLQGNVIQVENIAQEHHRDTQTGKGGGPVQRENYYTRTVAIRICRAAPLGGEMMLRRARVNGKLAYDATGSGQIDADSAKFFDGMRFYSGSETQMPDSALEALPASDGGGVGNVNAYRGSCYIVFPNLECPNGALPQFEFEVASAGTETTGFLPGTTAWVATNGTGKFLGSDGFTWDATTPISTSVFADGYFRYAHGRLLAARVSITGEMHASFDKASSWDGVANTGGWAFTYPITPTIIDGDFYIPCTSGIVHGNGDTLTLENDSVLLDSLSICQVGSKLIGGKGGDSGYVFVANNDFTSISNIPLLSNGVSVAVSNGTVAFLGALSEYRTTGDGITFSTTYTLPGSLSSQCGAASGSVFVIGCAGGTSGQGGIAVSTNACGSFTAVTLPETFHCYDVQIGNGLIVAVGAKNFGSGTPRVYTALLSDPTNFTLRANSFSTPDTITGVAFVTCDDGYQMPDAPGWYIHRDGSMCTTGATIHNVDPDTIDLADIVGDLTMRGGVTDYDVSALAGIAVTGYPILQPTSASAAIGVLQQVYFFDYPEWGNAGDLYPKLRAVLRGGASVLTLTDDDLVDTGDDDLTDSADGMGTRRQSVEFPMKLNFIAPDPTNNYETIKQTASRESENVKAASEVTITTPVLFGRDDSAKRAYILQNIAWDEAAGQIVRTVPEAFTVYTNSNIVTYGARRYRIDKIDAQDGQSKWTMTRDRASSLISNATGSTGITPPSTPSSMRGPTMLQVLNLPRLRSSDVGPGVYVGVCGLLPAWNGCDLYLSVDGGTTEQRVATIIDPATMGWVTADMATGDVTLAVQLYNDDELDDATDVQLALRMNACAATTAGVSEILQFKESTDTGTKTFDLTTLTRNLLGTTDATHAADSDFMLLDGSQIFVPLDQSLAGKTLIWRPVTRGTTPSANATYSMVFQPKFYGAQVVENYTDDSGEAYTDDSGNPYYKVIS